MGPCAAAVVAILLVATCVAAAPPLQQHHKPGRISGACPPLALSFRIRPRNRKARRRNSYQPAHLYPCPLLEIQIWPRELLPTAMPARSAPELIALPACALPRAAAARQFMAPPRVSCSLPRRAPFRLVCTQLGNWNWQPLLLGSSSRGCCGCL